MPTETKELIEEKASPITLDLGEIDLKSISDSALGLVMRDMAKEHDVSTDHYSHGQHNSNMGG